MEGGVSVGEYHHTKLFLKGIKLISATKYVYDRYISVTSVTDCRGKGVANRGNT